MPKGKGIYDDEDSGESTKDDRRGPTDQDGDSSTRSRDNAPDVADTRGEPTA
jgi:hypothetical protein